MSHSVGSARMGGRGMLVKSDDRVRRRGGRSGSSQGIQPGESVEHSLWQHREIVVVH